MAELLDPLDEGQRLLAGIVRARFAVAGQFPKHFYVEYCMRRKGHQAETVPKSFLSVGTHLRQGGYRAVDWWASGVTPTLGRPVRLTFAGLHHLQHDPVAGAIRRGRRAPGSQRTIRAVGPAMRADPLGAGGVIDASCGGVGVASRGVGGRGPGAERVRWAAAEPAELRSAWPWTAWGRAPPMCSELSARW